MPRPGKPWTESDVETAKFLRHCGLTDTDIGTILGGRSASSVAGKIGYHPSGKRYARFYERVRAAHAVMLGTAADNFQTRGMA